MKKHPHLGWIITLCLTGLGWLWALAGERSVTQEKIGKLESRVGAMQVTHNHSGQRLAEIQISVTQLQTDVAWIREEVARLRDR